MRSGAEVADQFSGADDSTHVASFAGLEDCSGCNRCVKKCSFLTKVGNPREIAASTKGEYDPFECDLCGLCAAVCPMGLDPARHFLEQRRELRRESGADDPRHSLLLAYERRGTSRLFNFYGLPKGCDTVFFPGCNLSGTRSGVVLKVYETLKTQIPGLGIVLDCCLKPSHDLGREEHFSNVFGEMRDYLHRHGVRKVLVACPNCRQIWSRHGGAISVQTVYEVLPENSSPLTGAASVEAVVHDPCVARFAPVAQDAARAVAARSGIKLAEMKNARRHTICCGRGGGANFVAPQAGERAVSALVSEAAGRPIVTYCGACAGSFAEKTTSIHVLDLWASPAEALAGKAKVSSAPFTYLNRLRLKRTFRRKGSYAVARERTVPGKSARSLMLSALLLLVLGAAAVSARATGASRFLEPEALRDVIEGYGFLGPLLYLALYALTPVLFLPGLPMTVAAGVLFGPFWGVVYGITGATLGACASFLVARYAARGWVEAKLTGGRWQRLDSDVAAHGWKIVALTRLIPLFPFNLLNYAYGVTKIPFSHYAVTSFLCMLPACVAYILFSSSLMELVHGHISAEFIAGVASIVAVSLIPLWWRRRGKKERAAAGAGPSAAAQCDL